jgi:hypothetical protein
VIPDLKPQDLIDHCRGRIAGGVKPATVNSDMTALRSTLTDYVESNDLPHEWLLVFAKVRRKLQKDQLVGKAEPRLVCRFSRSWICSAATTRKQNKHPRTRRTWCAYWTGSSFSAGASASSAASSASTSTSRSARTWVYDLKNSKGKGHHGEAPLIEGAWELVVAILAEIPNEPTARLFPYNSKTCSQRQTLAKKELQKEHPHLFQNLHMHDQRAEACVRLLEKGYSPLQVTKGVSLHFGIDVMVDRYARIKAADLHKGPVGTRTTP